jgi:hypothetical protein
VNYPPKLANIAIGDPAAVQTVTLTNPSPAQNPFGPVQRCFPVPGWVAPGLWAGAYEARLAAAWVRAGAWALSSWCAGAAGASAPAGAGGISPRNPGE